MDAEVVIVGTGVAGALIGWRLAARGARVLMLEAGPRVDRNANVNRARGALAKTPGSPYPYTPWAPSPDYVGPGADYYIQTGPAQFGSTYERVVGGTTWHWLGSMIRLLPTDFEMKTRYGVGVDWPITYQDLEPWYLEGEKQLGTSGDPAFDLGSPRSAPYPLPPIPQTYADKVIANGAAKLGWQVVPTPQARNSQEYQGRPQCCGNNFCIPICPIGAKYDASVHVALAEQAGARVIDNAVAYLVEVGADGRVTGIRYKRPDRSEASASGRLYVVAANAIETAKLLLISRTDRLPNGVANRSGHVGKNLADHPTKLSVAFTNEPIYPYRGPLATSGIEQWREGDFRGQRSAFRLELGNDGWSWPGLDPVGLSANLIAQGFRGAALYRLAGEQIPHQMRLASLCEQLPDERHLVTFDPAKVDDLGIPKPVLDYAIDDYTEAGLHAAEHAHDQLFDAVGVTYRRHFPGFYGAGHVLGTHRMGADPKTSVTDANGRTHDHPNLYLAGGGLFPTTGTANPTATVAALALRAAEAIAADLGALATPAASPVASPVG